MQTKGLSLQGLLLTFPDWRRPHENKWRVELLKKWCHVSGSVLVTCWQVGHPGMAAARLARVSGSSCYWAHSSLHLCQHRSLCPCAHPISLTVAANGNWLMSTGWVILSSWWFSASFVDNAFPWGWDVIRKCLCFLPTHTCPSTCVYPRLPCLRISSSFPSRPFTRQPGHWSLPKNLDVVSSWATSLFTQSRWVDGWLRYG